MNFFLTVILIFFVSSSYCQTGHKELPVFVDEEATYPRYINFVTKNLKYPERAIENNLQGKCQVSFIIDEKGKMSDLVVKKGVPNCPECDEEALRVIRKMKKWRPAKLGGKSVSSSQIAVINFILQ